MSQLGESLAVPTTFRHGPIAFRSRAASTAPAGPDLAALAAQAAAASAAAYRRHVAPTAPAEFDLATSAAMPTTFRHGPIVLRARAATTPPANPDLHALAAQAAAASAAAYAR
jgi:hypothetical protein